MLNIFKRNQTKPKYIVGKEYIINLEDIKISEKFKLTPPRPDKLRDKYCNYYYNNVKGMNQIKIDVNGTCIDGYCTYLLGRAFGIKEVKVLVGE